MEFDFTKFVKKKEPVIFEIGAHNGSDTEWFADNFENPTIHCFEPYTPMYLELEARMKKKKGCNVFLNRMALGDIIGTEVFYSASNTYSGSLKKPVVHVQVRPDILFDEEMVVGSTTLDMYVTSHWIEHIDLVYMDVQGAEDRVLSGGKNVFTNRVHYLYTEYSKVELYEGALNLDGIMRLLPGYRLLGYWDDNSWSGNALLVNKIFEES